MATSLTSVSHMEFNSRRLHPNAANAAIQNNPTIHGSNVDVDAAEVQLRQFAGSKYGSATEWFNAIKGKSGSISRQNWKIAMNNSGLAVNDETRKALRKRVAGDGSKLISLSQLREFMNGGMYTGGKGDTASAEGKHSSINLAAIPAEVPGT